MIANSEGVNGLNDVDQLGKNEVEAVRQAKTGKEKRGRGGQLRYDGHDTLNAERARIRSKIYGGIDIFP